MILKENEFLILALQETRIYHKIKIFEKYKFFNYNRKKNEKSNIVGFLINKNLIQKKKIIKKPSLYKKIDYIMKMKIILDNIELEIYNIYLNPSKNNFNEKIKDLKIIKNIMKKSIEKNKNIIILGDLNIDLFRKNKSLHKKNINI